MRLDQEARDLIATARIFATVSLLGDGAVTELEAAWSDAMTVVTGDGAGPADDGEGDIDGALLMAALIGTGQVIIGALLEIIDTDDEARLAMEKDTPRAEGKTVDIDPTLYAAWCDTRDMAKHWARQARAREIEVRREMGDAMTATVDGAPVIERIKRTENVRAHPRNVDYLRLIGLDGGPLQ